MKKLFLLALLSVAAISCGSDSDNQGPASGPGPVPSDFERVLNLMPVTAESRAYTRVNAWAAIAEAYGIEIPGPDATYEDVKAYRETILIRPYEPLGGDEPPENPPLFLFGEDWLSGFPGRYVSALPDRKVALGFDTHNVTISALSGESVSQGPHLFIDVVLGDINGALSTRLLDDCVMCFAPPDVIEYQEKSYYSWFESLRGEIDARLGLPVFDHIGRGGRLYVEDGAAARTMRTQDMQAFLDAHAGRTQRLGEIEEWRLAAAAMAELGAVSAAFTDESENYISDFREIIGMDDAAAVYLPLAATDRYRRFEEVAASVKGSSAELPAFEVAAAGSGWDGEKVYHAMALVFADEQIAVEAIVALRERASSGLYLSSLLEPLPWSAIIESAEFSVDGRVVSAKIYPGEPIPQARPPDISPFVPSPNRTNGAPFVFQLPYPATKIHMLFLLR